MKHVLNFLRGSLITVICFQLSLFAIPSGYAATCSNYDSTDDAEMITKQKACDAESDTYWDCDLGRCLTTEEASEAQEDIQEQFNKDAEECEKETDPAKRRQCYEDAAASQTGETLDEGEYTWQQGFAQTAGAIGVGIAIATYVSTKKIFNKGCISLSIFNVAAIGFIASEVYYYFMLKTELDTLKEEYVNNEDPYAAQLDAFNYLLDEQETLQGILDKKHKIAMGLMIAFIIAAVAAVAEGIAKAATGDFVCGIATSHSPSVPSNSLDEYFKPLEEPLPTQFANNLKIDKDSSPADTLISIIDNNNFSQGQRSSVGLNQYKNFLDLKLLEDLSQTELESFKEGLSFMAQIQNSTFPQAWAADEDATGKELFDNEEESIFDNGLYIAILTAGVGGAGALLMSIESIATPLQKFFINPWTLATLSTVIAVAEGILMDYYKKEYDDTETHIDTLETIIERFEASMQDYCSEDDRTSTSVPRCYCYNEDGTKNTTERGNSQICKNFWKTPGGDVDFHKANDATKSDGTKTGCVALNGAYDQSCKCRRFKDSSTGQNACYKSTFSASGISGLDSTVSNYLGSITSGVDSMASGNYTDALFGSDTTLTQNAAKSKKLLEKTIVKADSAAKKATGATLSQMSSALNKALSKTEDPKLVARYGGVLASDVAQEAQKKAPNAAAIKKALKKTGLGDVLYGNSKSAKKKKIDFSFLEENESAKSVSQVGGSDFMNKKYKIKHKDIVKNQNVSIWKVISNRYNQTGLRVLFED